MHMQILIMQTIVMDGRLYALHHMVYIEIVQLLLDHGADTHAVVTVDSTIDPLIKAGDTALDLAERRVMFAW